METADPNNDYKNSTKHKTQIKYSKFGFNLLLLVQCVYLVCNNAKKGRSVHCTSDESE